MSIHRTSNPAAVAWRQTTDDGVEVEVCWPRGTHSLYLSTRSADHGWTPATLIRNAAYDIAEPTLKAAERAAFGFLSL